MKTDELRQLLVRYGIDPLKARGQHFLTDLTVVRDAVEAAQVRPGDRVLEVGPGPGVLTEALLDAGAEVVAIDIDRRFAPLLEERFKGRKFTLKIADALTVSHTEVAEIGGWGEGEFKVVSNLPYGITSAFIVKCMSESPMPVSTTLLIQKEVADRITADEGDMNRLAVLVQTYAHAEKVRLVKPGAFLPPPRVDSAVIHIARRSEQKVRTFFEGVDPKTYHELVALGFSAPRKQLKNTIGSRFSAIPGGVEGALAAAGIGEKARPEEVGVQGWRALARVLTR